MHALTRIFKLLPSSVWSTKPPSVILAIEPVATYWLVESFPEQFKFSLYLLPLSKNIPLIFPFAILFPFTDDKKLKGNNSVTLPIKEGFTPDPYALER